MQRSSKTRYFAYSLILTLVGSLFSIVLPASQPSYASHENITVSPVDNVEHVYGPDDPVAIAGEIDDITDNEEVIIRIGPPGDSTPNEVESNEPDDNGSFEYTYDVSNSPTNGVYTVEVEYDGDITYTYFEVEDDDDAIIVELDRSDSTYEAGDQVTVSGRVDEEDNAEDSVHITVVDPTNEEIEDEDVELGVGAIPEDEFEFEFDLDDNAPHGRYAVMVTYDIDDQVGSTLFEIEDDGDSGGSGNGGSGNAVTSDSDGNLSAEIDEETYGLGGTVQITGEIEDYDSADNEDLSISIMNPDSEEIVEEDEAEVESNGDFEFEYELNNNADEGDYTITIAYDNDEVELIFEVEEGATGGGSGDDADITVKLDKASYLAGDSLTVTGTVADVADPEDGERVSVFVYHPGGQVILEPGSSKYVEPSSSGAYTATVVLPSDLDVDEDYKVKASYLGKTAELTFDITGVSSTPSDEVTVETDKDEYSVGSTVRVSGEVPDLLLTSGEPLLIRFNKPDGGPCRIDQVNVPASGSYTYSLVLGGTCGVAGEYEVEVTYKGEQSKTTFDLGGSSGATEYNLNVAGKSYPIEYELTDGSLNSISARPTENKLVVNINTDEDGQLTLVLPRDVIDAIEDGDDIDYIVTIEDESGNVETVEAEESSNTNDERTLVIDFEAGAERIEIIGTQVVPEFGAIAAIILAVAIVGIILATAKYGNKFSLYKQ